MRIMEFLCSDSIVIDLKATEKKAAIKELVDSLASANKIKDSDEITKTILEREKLGSTGIGQGVALPHGKTDVVKEQIGVIGISSNGVEFNSLDGEPVYLIFLLVGPVDAAGQHLKALARITRLFKDRFFRQALRDAKTVKAVVEIIEKEDEY